MAARTLRVGGRVSEEGRDMNTPRETALIGVACFIVVLCVVSTYLFLTARFIDWVMG